MPEQSTWSAWPAYERAQEAPCEICGVWADDCVCSECPKCGVQGDSKCFKEHGLPDSNKDKIKNIRELCEHNGAHEEEHDDAACSARVSRSLYNYTTCGISFYWNTGANYVSVAGYCEGSDGDIPPIVLKFPFTGEAFDEAVEQADNDGEEEWNRTHGCPLCFRHDGLTPEKINEIQESDEEVEGFDWEERPIDTDCPACEGDGIIK